MSEVVTEDRLGEIKRGFAVGLNRGDLGLHAEDVKWFISEVERLRVDLEGQRGGYMMCNDDNSKLRATITTLREALEMWAEHADIHVQKDNCGVCAGMASVIPAGQEKK